MVTHTAATVNPRIAHIAAIRKVETRLEEAHDTYAVAITELRRAERQGRWEDAREWRTELAGVERDIARLQSRLDDLTDDGQEQAYYVRGYGEMHA